MDYFNAFWTGGLICTLVQILLDRTKLMPGRIMVLLVCGMGHFAAFAQDDSFGMPPLVDDTSADFPDESVNLVMIEPFRSLEIRASYGIQAVAIIPEGETYGDYDLFI